MPRKGPENKFRARICKELIECNAKVYPILGSVQKFDGGDRIISQNPGMSDIICVHKYIGIVFLEFKAESGKLSVVQKRFLEEVNERCPLSGFVVREGKNSGYIGELEDIGGNLISRFENGKDLINCIQSIQKV